MSQMGWQRQVSCLCREHLGSWPRWRAIPLPQTQCCSWTGGTTIHHQTLRCRRATGMQSLQSLSAGSSCYPSHLWVLSEEAQRKRWPKPGDRMPDCGCCPCRKLPTFLYAMPFSDTRLFLEETSLVARPAVPFEELKQRLDARLAHYGIRIKCAVPVPKPHRLTGCLLYRSLLSGPRGLDGAFHIVAQLRG